MRLAACIALLAALFVVAPVADGAPKAVKVTLVAPGHAPRVGKRWVYSVHATSRGKPVAARITAQIVDPIGGSHPVNYGTTSKPIVNRRFKGVFRDFVEWPRSSRGIPLRFRVIVVAAGAKRTIDYPVTPRS
jgi:hypothetical protein